MKLVLLVADPSLRRFAKSLNYSVEDFAHEALFAKHPIDLGTRCTVL